MNQFVRPVNIPSPISGQPVAPKIIRNDFPDKVVVEAHWIDPQSGAFIRKGIVEIQEKVSDDFPSPEAIDVLLQCCDGEKDMYDVMYHPKTDVEREAGAIIEDYYNNVVQNNAGLHPDDDFESIFEIVAQRIYDDYGR